MAPEACAAEAEAQAAPQIFGHRFPSRETVAAPVHGKLLRTGSGRTGKHHRVAHEANVVAAVRRRGGGLAVVLRRADANADARMTRDALDAADDHHGTVDPAVMLEARREVGDFDSSARRVVHARHDDRRIVHVALLDAHAVHQLDGVESDVAGLAGTLLQQRAEHRERASTFRIRLGREDHLAHVGVHDDGIGRLVLRLHAGQRHRLIAVVRNAGAVTAVNGAVGVEEKDREGQFANRNGIAFLEPAVGREIAHAGHAKACAARDDVIQQRFVGDVRAFDRHFQRIA